MHELEVEWGGELCSNQSKTEYNHQQVLGHSVSRICS